ncbi:MAG: ATP-binding protein [Lachnospiraceae bacterium]|nr:ATP-binding protein [Lachnospiraceae bacterium]
MDNPFLIGPVVTGESFIGRRKLIEELERKYISGGRSGSLSIYGMPRVGKSSLIYNLFRRPAAEENPGLVTVTVDLGMQESFFSLWRNIVRGIRRAMRKKGIGGEEADGLFEVLSELYTSYELLIEDLEDLFDTLNEMGVRLLICIDEFDACTRIFADENASSSTYFQFLRTVATNPEYNVSFVLISRRSLEHLEEKAGGGSVLHLALEKRPISGFDEADKEAYKRTLAAHGVEVGKNLEKKLWHYGGGSPYLLSILGSTLVNEAPEKDLDKLYPEYSQQFLDYYKRVSELLKEEDYYKRMLEAFVGPKYDLTQSHVQELINRGYVTRTKEGKFATVSEDFRDYLFETWEVEGSGEIWPLLTETENRLRSVIDQVMTRAKGRNWERVMEAEYETRVAADPSAVYFVDFAKAARFIRTNVTRYGGRAGRVLNVIGLQELANIMEFYWNLGFSAFFGNRTFSDWKDRFAMLSRARNPLAHGNPECLTAAEIQTTNTYCREVLEVTARGTTS